jgi:DNA-binding CsgD family transcriptional regulator
MPAEEFQKTDLHRMALAPLGINYQIGGMLAVLGASAHVITVHRTHHNFTEREREILNALHPHLVTSYLNAFALRRANRSVTELKAVMETAPGAYGYFYSDTSPAWLQPRTREWLVEFFPDEAKDALNIPLYLLAQLRQSRDEGGTPKSFSRPSGTETLTGILAQSPLGGWILRLERKPKSPPPRFRALCQLTARENDVLRWMVEGKRNAEIAKILGTSSRTVEKQVEAILAKLAVENRATAILRAMELAAATQQNGAGI